MSIIVKDIVLLSIQNRQLEKKKNCAATTCSCTVMAQISCVLPFVFCDSRLIEKVVDFKQLQPLFNLTFCCNSECAPPDSFRKMPCFWQCTWTLVFLNSSEISDLTLTVKVMWAFRTTTTGNMSQLMEGSGIC